MCHIDYGRPITAGKPKTVYKLVQKLPSGRVMTVWGPGVVCTPDNTFLRIKGMFSKNAVPLTKSI